MKHKITIIYYLKFFIKIFIIHLSGQHEKDANPIQDILMIYNYCILKYSYKFTNIIISIPEEMVEDYFSIVN